MLACAMHVLQTEDTCEASIDPDGQQNRQFPFADWLDRHGFTKASSIGTSACGGKRKSRNGQTVTVNPKSGLGANDLVAECKGGSINSRHPGQRSRLRRGLCEAVGLSMTKPSTGRQVAVVPETDSTLRLAGILAPWCVSTRIGIALVGNRGKNRHVRPNAETP